MKVTVLAQRADPLEKLALCGFVLLLQLKRENEESGFKKLRL
jgi:hypothetical protein